MAASTPRFGLWMFPDHPASVLADVMVAAEEAGLYEKQVPARQLYSRMMRTLAQTGNGWITFKDASNEKCNQTGYKGRVGLYEVMEIGEELRELILVGASGLELRRKAVDEGMITLRHSGLRKVKEGVTTVEEVVRETVK